MRDQILAEIKRIAEANGGQAPGQNVFAKETGFKPHMWAKYWARWGDAVRDAGLTAQIWQQKLDVTLSYPKLAEAVRHFRRFPTDREMLIYRQRDKTFPNVKSVLGHFESKPQLIEALKTWAEVTEGYSDVAALLPANVAQAKDIPGNSPSLKEGYVYLIRSGAFYKIGRGDQLEKRVKQIRTALPDASTLEHSIKTDDPAGIEAYWHRRFDDKRANGEWFKLSLQDVAAFKRRKYQ